MKDDSSMEPAALNIGAIIQLLSVDKREDHRAKVIDMAATWVMLETAAPVHEGNLLKVHFTLPRGDQHIEGYAEVVWVRRHENRLGARFQIIARADADAISREMELLRGGRR